MIMTATTVGTAAAKWLGTAMEIATATSQIGTAIR
jgi:hypothetical protein